MRYDPLNSAINQNPYPHYDVLRREEPICWIDSMQAEEEGQTLTEDEILAMGILLLIGGTETTTNLLGNTLILLHERPDVYDAIKRDPALVPDLFEEVLRFNTPVQMVFRNTVQAVRYTDAA